MAFTSFNFLIFFPAIVIIYWLLPSKLRVFFLVVSSYFFYLNVKPVYSLLLIYVSVLTYLTGIFLGKAKLESRKRNVMLMGIIMVLLPLVFFKYFPAINLSLFSIMDSMGVNWSLPDLRLILPIGISFYTFMALGYIIDVYNEEIEVERNPLNIALFISFFPLILSGPIERANNMIPQFKTVGKINFLYLSSGLKIILWGYFMKLVVADRLGIYIDAVYNNVERHNGTSLLFATLLYPFQLYGDLGGYSLIAIGTAKMLGFDVISNFNRPFFAQSMSDFWRRWHISLIKWLTDYIYTPLSFMFRGLKVWGIVLALLVTFFISGIWHAAAMTFVIWGLVQGIYLSIEALTLKKKKTIVTRFNLSKKRWYIFLGIVITFILFSASQVFGRASSLDQAFLVFSKMLFQHGSLFLPKTTLVFALLGLIILFLNDFFEEFYPGKLMFFNNKSVVVRFGSYMIILFVILYIGVLDSTQFLYFQY